jgi:hypothetical protein
MNDHDRLDIIENKNNILSQEMNDMKINLKNNNKNYKNLKIN